MPDLPNKRIPPPLGGMKPPMRAPGAPGIPGARPPMMPGQGPALPGAAKPPIGAGFKAGLPSVSAANSPASAAIEERLRKMEEHSREIEDSKKKLEKALAEMEMKLKDEKEKALSQAIKAREEESLSLKMEQALKEMQDKARGARREQEMEEARARAEEKVKDLERRLNEEREAWVINLKKQMELRDHETKQVEGQIDVRFRDLEKRWLEERSALLQSLKAKEEEAQDLKQGLVQVDAEARRSKEDALKTLEHERKNLAYEFEAKKDEALRQKDSYASKLESRERELMTLKAQLAMVDSQVRMAQESSQKSLNEKERAWQMQVGDLDREFSQLKQTRDQLAENLKRMESERFTSNEQVKNSVAAIRQLEQKNAELRLDLVRKNNESDALGKELFSERQTWSGKIEERILIERSLQEALNVRESELGRLKSAMAALESRLKEQFDKERKEVGDSNQRLIYEKDQTIAGLNAKIISVQEQIKLSSEKEKNILRFESQDKLAQRDREIAALKLEFSQMRSELLAQFEKEKSTQAGMHQQQFHQELSLRSELMQKELDEAHQSVLANLGEFEKKFKVEDARHNNELQAKEVELARSAQAIRSLEEEIMEQKQTHLKDQGLVEKKFSDEIILLKESLNQLREAFHSEKECSEELRSELESRENYFQKSGIQFDGSDHSQLSFSQLVWKYLTRTVIVINFKGVPRKFKKIYE